MTGTAGDEGTKYRDNAVDAIAKCIAMVDAEIAKHESELDRLKAERKQLTKSAKALHTGPKSP